MSNHSHTNQLAGQKSPYLLQHQHNPVDWLPWGEEAFARARAEDKPIFLSIGYSTCHWCHVMERESFENETVAHFMNEYFINIKVDREERPDVDRVYMTFVQATTGSGGWPMSVFLTPELKPFYGGTYFPPDDRYGRPGFASLLQHIARSWEEDRAKIEESGSKVLGALGQYAELRAAKGDIDWPSIIENCHKQLVGSYDSRYGGFGEAPKFPRPVIHDFLNRYYAATDDQVALHTSAHTLRAMALGGMNDQLGGGFHRYSVDEQWIVSHFEKMLYDQAQLVISYLEVHQITADEGFAQTARDTLNYVLRDMTHPAGGFFAAEDADSYESAESQHKEEGAFYVWTTAQLEAALGAEQAALFEQFYGVRPEGNAPPQGDPHGEFKGKNILFRAKALADLAEATGKDATEIYDSIQQSAALLFDLRESRPRPHRDEKIIVAWNGLMISAFARAAGVLREPAYAEAAAQAADFIRDELYDPATGQLNRHWQNGAADVPGFVDDYAYLVRGLIDLFEATGDYDWLQWAESLNETQLRLFWDDQEGGYFNSAPDPHVLLRMKEDYDGAEPAPGSISAFNNLRLALLLDRDDLREIGESTLRAFAGRVQLIPQAMPALLAAAIFAQSPPLHVVIVGSVDSQDTQSLLNEVNRTFLPNKILILTDGEENELTRRLPFIAGMTKMEGKATAYVCRDFACRQPVTLVEDLQVQLSNS